MYFKSHQHIYTKKQAWYFNSIHMEMLTKNQSHLDRSTFNFLIYNKNNLYKYIFL